MNSNGDTQNCTNIANVREVNGEIAGDKSVNNNNPVVKVRIKPNVPPRHSGPRLIAIRQFESDIDTSSITTTTTNKNTNTSKLTSVKQQQQENKIINKNRTNSSGTYNSNPEHSNLNHSSSNTDGSFNSKNSNNFAFTDEKNNLVTLRNTNKQLNSYVTYDSNQTFSSDSKSFTLDSTTIADNASLERLHIQPVSINDFKKEVPLLQRLSESSHNNYIGLEESSELERFSLCTDKSLDTYKKIGNFISATNSDNNIVRLLEGF